MRFEQLPIVFGVLVALLGLLVLGDAWFADSAHWPFPERRRRARTTPNRVGETLVGFGMFAMAAALIGRDTWRWGTVAVLAGTALLLLGAALNTGYLRELLLFRGAARRQDDRKPRTPEEQQRRGSAKRGDDAG